MAKDSKILFFLIKFRKERENFKNVFINYLIKENTYKYIVYNIIYLNRKYSIRDKHTLHLIQFIYIY